MANRWGIPHDVETAVIARDQSCVYCGVLFENKSTTSKKHGNILLMIQH